MSLWVTMVAAGLLTFLIRLSFIGAAGRLSAPVWFTRLLRFVPVAALTALIGPDLLLVDGALAPANPRLWAGGVAAMVAWRSGSIFLTIGSGMLSLWSIQWLA